MNALAETVLTPDELAKLCAVDTPLYASTFFPGTFRQAPASFHTALWKGLEANQRRLLNFQVMRDGAKTTILRAFISKRIAYGVSRTILYIGKSDDQAKRSLNWLRSQVYNNHRWAQFYGIEKGETFNDGEAVFLHKTLNLRIWMVAVGINGSLRGINLDDHRPDLIILDDAIDDDNAATPLGRKKTSERIHGAIKESLAPASEAPMAKLVMLNTPIGMEDASMDALTDPEFYSLRFPCWTIESEEWPIDQRISSWEERYPTETMRQQKRSSIQQGRAHVFAREKECKIITPETAPLRREWLKYYETLPPREEMQVCMSIDPVPKPSAQAISRGLHRLDFEAHSVWGRHKTGFYQLEYLTNRGHEPNWTIMAFWHLVLKWKPSIVRVETIAYQATLSWILSQSMKAKGIYVLIDEVADRRNKIMRIIDTFSGVGSQGEVYIDQKQTDFIDQWSNIESTSHDDVIDAAAMCVEWLHNQKIVHDLEAEYEVEYEKIPDSAFSCP